MGRTRRTASAALGRRRRATAALTGVLARPRGLLRDPCAPAYATAENGAFRAEPRPGEIGLSKEESVRTCRLDVSSGR